MSVMSDIDLQLQELIYEPSTDPVGRTLHDAFSALDDLAVLASRPETREQVKGERHLIRQLLARCQALVVE